MRENDTNASQFIADEDICESRDSEFLDTNNFVNEVNSEYEWSYIIDFCNGTHDETSFEFKNKL